MVNRNLQPPFSACNGEKPYAFVSYAHENSELVFPIIKKLYDIGFEMWYDQGIHLGAQDFKRVIVDFLHPCNFMLLFISPDTFNSEYMKKEIEFAMGEKIAILPIYLAPTEIPPVFRFDKFHTIQGIMKYEMDEDAFFSELIGEISNSTKYSHIIQSKNTNLEKSASTQFINAWEPPLEDKVQLLIDVIQYSKGKKKKHFKPQKETSSAYKTHTRSTLNLGNSTPKQAPLSLEQIKVNTNTHKGEEILFENPNSEDLIKDVENALKNIILKTGASIGGPWIRDSNSMNIWRELYNQYNSSIIKSLLQIINDPKRDWKSIWKGIKLLNYCVRIPENRDLIITIFEDVANHIVKGGHVQNLTIEVLKSIPLSPQKKWTVLFPILQVAPSKYVRRIIPLLIQVTPVNERKKTGELLLNMLLFADSHSIGAIIDGIKKLNLQTAIPELRNMVLTSSPDIMNKIVELLVFFEDLAVIPIIRQSIEIVRYNTESAQIISLLKSLYVMEKESCTDYFIDVLMTSLQSVQNNILVAIPTIVRGNPISSELLNVVSLLADKSSDKRVKKTIDSFLNQNQ